MVNKEKDKSTEEKILDAARKVFVLKGLDGARMQDIADEAGINKALLHYYFRTKDKLFEMIFMETVGKIFPRFEMILLSDMDLFDKIRQIVSSYIEVIIHNPYLPLFVLNEMNKNPEFGIVDFFKVQRPMIIHRFMEDIEKEVSKGTIKAVSPAHLLVNMMSMCIFPFVAKPVINIMLDLDELQFRNMMEQRKRVVAEFIIESIKN
jgi:AcrR family transcriptional regulator